VENQESLVVVECRLFPKIPCFSLKQLWNLI